MKRYCALLPLLFLAGCRHRAPMQLPGEMPALPPVAANDGGMYRDFHTLTLQTTGGFAGINDTLKIEGDRIFLMQSRPVSNRSAPFSSADRRELAQLLQRSEAAKLAGKYEQKELRDGFGETLTILLGGKDKRKIEIENYGDRAPAAYYEITKYLRQLQGRKFLPQ